MRRSNEPHAASYQSPPTMSVFERPPGAAIFDPYPDYRIIQYCIDFYSVLFSIGSKTEIWLSAVAYQKLQESNEVPGGHIADIIGLELLTHSYLNFTITRRNETRQHGRFVRVTEPQCQVMWRLPAASCERCVACRCFEGGMTGGVERLRPAARKFRLDLVCQRVGWSRFSNCLCHFSGRRRTLLGGGFSRASGFTVPG